jgi:RHS repeat-associated protein
MPMRTSRLLIALFLGVASTCFAQAPTWTQKCLATSPPARYATRMAYDAARGQLVMFGGGATIPSPIIFDDTWVWDGVSWTQKFPATNPPPKSSQSMAYDAARQQVVMFGGTIGNAISADTWVWDGINWTQKFPATNPSARLHADMAYDAAHQQVVLFGGGPGDPSSFADTWVWDGTNWTQKFPATSPPARSGQRMAYDTARGQIVLFAGRGGSDGNTFFSDTWVWDGTNWTQKFPATSPPTPRFQYGLAYDAAGQQVVLFGGQGPNNTPIYGDTWVWDGTTWIQQLPATIPPGRTLPAMAYDAAHAQVVLFGGFTGPGGLSGSFANDTWVWGAPASSSCPPPISSLGSGTSGGSSATSAGDKLDTQGKANEPISTGNGNYYYQHTDFMIPGRGMPLVFQRSYNVLDNYAGQLGANWTHSYNIVLSQPVSGTAVIKWGDGHGETFTLSGGIYLPQPGVFNTLVKNADSTFTLTRKDQTQFAFSAGGAVTSIRDKNGNTVTLTYNGSGNLIQITDTVGRNLVFAYDASNRITQITDPIGRTVSLQYDANNNLVQATDSAGGITTFAYDTNHRVTSITQPNGQTLLTNTYDSSGRVITQTGGRGFSSTLAYDAPNPRDTTIIDARGNQTIHSYDSSLRIVKITDASAGITSFTYDANNDRTSVTNQNGKTTNLSYDSAGNITNITDPVSNSTVFSYDAKNDLLTATNPKGKTTSFTYDSHGNLKTIVDALSSTTTFNYDGLGQLTAKTDARGNATSYSYDSQGNLTRITDAVSHNTVLAYDGIGRLTSITDPNSHTAIANYDALSRLVKVTDPLSNQTQFTYDTIGNLLRITDAKGNATNYAYDATNNLITVTDALSHVTRYAYDANNNRITFTNAKGNATNYAYDALNRLTRITDPLSFVPSYSYDAVGNVLAVLDAKGQNNQFTYDALNRLLGIAYADGKNVTYSYDADGNRTSMADFHGTTAYSYDSLDRLTSVTNPGAKVVTYTYDAVGNRKSLTYPDGKVVNYSFDPANRLSAATDWLGRNTAYTYDAASNLTKTSYPNGAGMAFSYDAANRLLQAVNSTKNLPLLNLAYTLDAVGNRAALSVNGLTTNYAYDTLNELLSAQLGFLKSTWTYDAVGNRLRQTSPLGTIAYTYDADDRLLTAGTSTFTYDADGNQISKTQSTTGQPIVYAYDAANRLVNVIGGVFTSSFSYDGDGNRFSQSTSRGTYNYLNDVATALPVVLQESGPDGNISYAYGLGLISESSPTFNYFYHYDGLGSVIALTDASGVPKAGYAYDPWGNPLINVSDSVGTKNKFRFTGEALDPGTQLYYLRARYYDPAVGRFLGRDPLPGNAAFPLSRNAYGYSLSNPLGYRDPSGLSAIQSSTAQTASVSGVCGDFCQRALQAFGVAVAKAYIEIQGILNYGVTGSGGAVSAGSGVKAVLSTGKELRDPWDQLTDFYNSATQEQRDDVDSRMLLDCCSGKAWSSLSPDQKKMEWKQDGIFAVNINNLYLHKDYTLLPKYAPLPTSIFSLP